MHPTWNSLEQWLMRMNPILWPSSARSKALAYPTLHTVRPAPSREMRLGGLLFDGLEARRMGRSKQHIESWLTGVNGASRSHRRQVAASHVKRTSTGHEAKQYWSRSEAVLVSYSYHYWSECEPLLVNSPTSSGYFSPLIATLIAPFHRISLYPRQIAPQGNRIKM